MTKLTYKAKGRVFIAIAVDSPATKTALLYHQAGVRLPSYFLYLCEDVGKTGGFWAVARNIE